MNDSKKIIQAVEEIVSPVYLVGGSVRDIILGRTPKDYDFTTPLSPDEVENKVKAAGRRAYAIGKKFGTIGFKVKDSNGVYQYVEVTTFRRERYNPGSRKPEVEFVTDLKEDLSRRDFTINAIALRDGEFFDPFGGRIDIMAKKIKAVGDSKSRFKEDPLRILRAARFSGQLDFVVDPNMVGTARKLRHSIVNVSRERWVQELDKLLISPQAKQGLWYLQSMGVLKIMLPEVYILLMKTPDYYDSLFVSEQDPDDRWAELIMQLGRIPNDDFKKEPRDEVTGTEIATGICQRLKFSNDRTKKILHATKKQRI